MSSSIEGINNLMKELESLGKDSKKMLKKSMEKQIKFVQGEAKTMCPVYSGQLRNSITTNVEETDSGIVATCSTNCEYAPYVCFGTGVVGQSSNGQSGAPKYTGALSYAQYTWSYYDEDEGKWWINVKGQPAQPFLYPALKNNEEKVLEAIREDLINELRRFCQ